MQSTRLGSSEQGAGHCSEHVARFSWLRARRTALSLNVFAVVVLVLVLVLVLALALALVLVLVLALVLVLVPATSNLSGTPRIL